MGVIEEENEESNIRGTIKQKDDNQTLEKEGL